MNNNVELLRAICFTSDDMATIKNLGGAFTDKEIEFMVEFKKIYELGVTQLEKFINKLDSEGSDLDTYTIQYYITLLKNGPLSSYLPDLIKDKKYFVDVPDSMGMMGNKTMSSSNNTIYETIGYPLGCSVDVFNSLPKFSQLELQDAIKTTEDIFRSGLRSSSEIDNTLPIADKAPQLRYNEEKYGKWVNRSNASYMVKDIAYYLTISDKSQEVFDKVQTYLSDENFRIYRDNKEYSPFDSEKNSSVSANSKLEKELSVGDTTQIVMVDLLGDDFDSEEKRSAKLKIVSPNRDKEYLLNSNAGQLGN